MVHLECFAVCRRAVEFPLLFVSVIVLKLVPCIYRAFDPQTVYQTPNNLVPVFCFFRGFLSLGTMRDAMVGPMVLAVGPRRLSVLVGLT